ncbi:MAG: PLP-dependent transferase [Eubacterium sp.]|nr:PLP-dependent transferase [Eubacterium sp.]
MEYDCLETKCIHLSDMEEEQRERDGIYGAVSYPIFQSATFSHRGIGVTTGYDYSRQTNPTRHYLERTIASLEKGADAVAFSTGMAAITAVMELFLPGDHIITEADLYGGTIRLFDTIGKKNGLRFSHIDIESEDPEEYLNGRTKAVYIETPTNPMMRVVDMEKVKAFCSRHKLLMIVDNTFLTPYLQNPLSFGADIVIHSGTKYISGHNDVLAGFAVTATKEMGEKLHLICTTTGASLAPFDAWLVQRGVKTLALRVERASENTAQIAKWLKTMPDVEEVFYPGDKESEGYSVMKRQARGFGAMLSFNMKSEEQARSILTNVRLIQFAESLGGVETLITYPLTQTHADVPEEVRKKTGLTGKLLRLSIGIENYKDLIKDLEQAFILSR